MIKIENLHKTFQDFSLTNINLEIKSGEYFIILGPSGAGKTLLLEIMAGLIKPDQGKMTGLQRSKVGLIYQDLMLFPHINVGKNISYGLQAKKEKKDTILKKTIAIAKEFEIETLLQRNVNDISGGEKQRVALARTMVLNPEVYLLDEPTSSLDLSTKNKTQALLQNLHKESKPTMIHVTHDFDEALALGERIAVMMEGRIVQIDTPEKIFNSPVSKDTADFLGYKNVFSGNIKEYKMYLNGKEIFTPLKTAGRATIAIRSCDILLSGNRMDSSARNSLRGKVKQIVSRGNYVEVLIDIGIPLFVDITYQSLSEMNIEKGSILWATFKTSAIKLFEH